MKDNKMGDTWHVFNKYIVHIFTEQKCSKLPTQTFKKGDGIGRSWDGCPVTLQSHYVPVLPSYRNQSIDFHCKSVDWFLYGDHTSTYWVKLPQIWVICIIISLSCHEQVSLSGLRFERYFSHHWVICIEKGGTNNFVRVTTILGNLY